MRNKKFALLCIIFTVLFGWTECGEKMPVGVILPGSPVTVTPDDDVEPMTSLQTVSPTMPVIGSDLQALALAILNAQNGTVNGGGALVSAVGYPDGARAFVRPDLGFGWYWRKAGGSGFSSDSNWLIASADGGQWMHELHGMAISKMIAAIGPVPGQIVDEPTPVGKINKQFIVRGYYTHRLRLTSHVQDNTTSGTAVTFQNLAGTGVSELDVGTLGVADIVDVHICAMGHGNSAAAFNYQVWAEYQENGGSWTAITSGSTVHHRADTSNSAQTLNLSFTRQVAAAGTFKVRVRMVSDGTNSLVVDIDTVFALVTRE